MKYTFDVDEKNNKFEIRLEITKTGGYNSTAAKTINVQNLILIGLFHWKNFLLI